MDTRRVPAVTEPSASTTACGTSVVTAVGVEGGMTKVSAVRRASGPCSTVIEKSELVRTGRPSTLQVRTS